MSLLQHLQNIPDPRVQRTRRHELQSILVVALCATIAGADNCVEMAEFGLQHQDWFERLVPLPSGIASHDTFARVFRLLDAKELERACKQWLDQVAGRVHGTVAIDGKSVRGSSKGDAQPPGFFLRQSRSISGTASSFAQSNSVTFCSFRSAVGLLRSTRSSPRNPKIYQSLSNQRALRA